MTDPQLTVAREVNLAHRFSVDEEKAREWLGRIVAAYPDEARDVSAEAPTISADWNARSDGAEWTAERLVRGAVEDGILTCPDGMDVNFIYEPDASDGGSYHFAVDIGHDVATQVSLNTWGFEMRKLGDPDATGIEAALSILDEAESYSNKALADLAPLIAAQRRQGSLTASLTPADGSEDPRVTAARALVNGPLPRSDRQLPSHVLTSWYHELNRATRGLLEVIDGQPAGTEASRVHGPDEPAAPTLAARPDRPLDQIRHLIVQAGTACTHLATIAPDGPAAARQATEIIGLLTRVRDLAVGRHAHDAAGSSVNPSASPAATLAAAGFPRPPLSADPGADGANARKPDTSHPGQQVPPRTRGRHQ